MSLWSLDNPIFQQYVFHAALVALKLLMMAPLVGRMRFKKQAFVNPEDAAAYGPTDNPVVKMNDPDVERIRRAHMNDLENIPAFWILGLLYVLTGPSPFMASICFRGFSIARICHTFCYLNGIGLGRGLGFGVGLMICFGMGISVMLHFCC